MLHLPPSPEKLTPDSPGHLWLVRVQSVTLLGLMAVMSLVNTAGLWPGPNPTRMPLMVPLLVAQLMLASAAALWSARRGRRWWRLPPGAWLSVGGATVMFCYGLGSLVTHDRTLWLGVSQQPVMPAWSLSVWPLVCALLTLWAGFLTVVVQKPRDRFAWLWQLAALMVPMSLIGWFRVWWQDGTRRLWTQAGGSAVYPMVLVMCLAIALAGVVRPYRPRASIWLAITHLVLILLTGSRAGLVMLVAFAVAAVLRLARTHRGVGERLVKLPKRVFLIGGAAIAAATVFSPVLARFDDRSEGRLMTWRAGMRALSNPVEVIFGAGSGSTWPWYVFESGWLDLPWRGRITTQFGQTLYHPHSVYLEVLVELGLVGLVLLSLVISPVVRQWLRGGPVVSVLLSSVVAATMVGFAVDTYLFKNFPISLVWWLVVFVVLTTYTGGYPATTSRSAADDDTTGAPTP